MLLKEGISGKAFAQNYVRRCHATYFAVVDNHKSCYENIKKEFKEQQEKNVDGEESSVDNLDLEDFTSFQTPSITMKDRRNKLQ